jgi:iron complex outermembrane recepter protein
MKWHGLAARKHGVEPSLRRQARLVLYLLPGLVALPSYAAVSTSELANLSFEDLADIRITSVSKKPERLADAAASVFVITNEDLRRSGVANLPEALRLAPNLHVAQTSAYGYSISARGFNDITANKLLVLIDGRSVYTPLFAGVFWDVQDLMLEDIDRIEVISGPGGTLWGTNAVNGVINILTRSAKHTQGGLAAARSGNRESDTAFRYGATADNGISYRVYGKYTYRNHTETENGSPADDALHKAQAGFRADWEQGEDRFTVQGDAYGGTENQPRPGLVPVIFDPNQALGAISVSGANLMAHWERTLAADSRVSLQAHFDRTARTVPPTFSESLNIVDVQFQHSLSPAGRHALTWGAQYRYGMDRVVNSRNIAFLPANVDQQWASLFLQDDMTLRPDVHFTLGARVERNDYTGNEFLPSARIAWKFAPERLLWSALSRTVRAPSRLDRDTFLPGVPPFLFGGGTGIRSELANVFEIGYRAQPTAELSYSVTAYYAAYDRLRTQEIVPGSRSQSYSNEMEGATDGIEMWGTYRASKAWRLSGGLVAQHEHLTLDPGSTDQGAAARTAGEDPAHKWIVRSSLDLSPRSELDFTVSHVAALSSPAVPAYTAVSLRYGWRPNSHWELSVIGKNLVGGEHAEFSSAATRSAFGRSVSLMAVGRF